ncbi:MAG: ester cyclase [Acidobacteriia bacterium]|nr:ester cyclase [Terriglobia bacterium]
MTHQEIRTLVEKFVRAWAAEDLDALLACYDENAELVSPLLHTQRGIEAIERSHQDLFLAFSDVVADVHDIVIDVEHQKAVLVFTINATQKADFHGVAATGRRVETPSAFVFHFKNGRIVSDRRLYDYGGFLMQLGILKTRGV